MVNPAHTNADQLIHWVEDARQRTFDLVSDLSDEQLVGPKLPTINPLVWEIGHAAWFQEKWVLRHVFEMPPISQDMDNLYDSIAIDHDIRWDLPLLSREQICKYLCEVRGRTIDALSSNRLTDQLAYFVKLSVFHEDMHTEAFTYTRQTLGYPRPTFTNQKQIDLKKQKDESNTGDAHVPGGTFLLGSTQDEPFVFDNEKWAHAANVRPFSIATSAVTQGEYCEFIEDNGYTRQELWSDEGWRWREQTQAQHPLDWRREASGQWIRREFDQWLPLDPAVTLMNVNWHEAQAYCRWARRRLPTELEWEVAASVTRNESKLGKNKRRYPWGNDQPEARHANLDWQQMGPVPPDAFLDGDSGIGCHQMLGNVWEWTDTTFRPFPGFQIDPYKEYSSTSFDHCKVLRGGCWTTRSRLIRNTWRNFYRPDRRDVWAGFRTCALGDDTAT